MPTSRSANWGRRRFDSDDWIERHYGDAATGERLTLTVVRSLDAKSVYHHPELAIADDTSFVDLDVQRFDGRDIPVYVLQPGQGDSARAMYALHYGDGFVENPIVFQLQNAGELLFSRRKPMTLFFVLNRNPRRDSQAVPRLLFAAIDSFLAARIQ